MSKTPVQKTLDKLAKRKSALPVPISLLRVEETADMVLAFKPRQDIVKHLMTTYGLKKRSTDIIITKAYEHIRNNYPVDRESIVLTHLNYYYDIATKWKDIDPKACLKALEQIEKLLKLHQENPLIQQNTLNMNFEKVSTDELLKAIEAMRTKAT